MSKGVMAEAFPERQKTDSEEPYIRVSEEDVLALARDIPHDQFLAIGQRLGFHLQELQNWKQHDYNHDLKGACEHMLMAWRNREEGATKERLQYLIAGPTPGKPLTSPEAIMSKLISANLTVRECQQRLIDHYKRTARIQLQPGQEERKASFDDLYTRITLHKNQSGVMGKDILKEELKGSINDIFETEVNGHIPPRIVLLGAAGLGKTTSLAKLAHDWAVDEDSTLRRRFTLLFWLKFRNSRKDCSLGEAIVTKLLQQFRGVTRDEMESFITNYGGQCGILLDGYDEFGGTKSQTSLVDLIRYHRFPDCRVLVSTRPHLASHFKTDELSNVYAVMELEGFAEVDGEKYIDKFFVADPPKGHRLKEYLRKKFNLASLLRIPFFCMVLCILWGGDYLVDVETTSDVFESYFKFLAAHAKAKQTTLTNAIDCSWGHLRTVLVAIGKTVFESFVDDSKRLIFNIVDFKDCLKELEIATHLGLLHTYEKDSNDILEPRITCCEFYHKLAQEHCAGVYLSSLSKHELEQKLSLISREMAGFEHVLRFAAESEPQSSKRIIRLITRYKLDTHGETTESKSKLHTLVLDIVGISTTCGTDERNQLLRSFFSDNSINITQANKSTIVGIENLPSSIKHRIIHLYIVNTRMGPELSQRFRSSLSSFHALSYLDTMASHISLPPDAPLLPAVRILRTDADTLSCLIGSLPGLHKIIVLLKNPDDDVRRLADSLSRTPKEGIRQIFLKGTDGTISRANLRTLCDVVKRKMTGLEVIHVWRLTIDYESAVYFVETCQSLESMREIQFWACVIIDDGSLYSHLEWLHHPRGVITVEVHEPNNCMRYTIPRISH